MTASCRRAYVAYILSHCTDYPAYTLIVRSMASGADPSSIKRAMGLTTESFRRVILDIAAIGRSF